MYMNLYSSPTNFTHAPRSPSHNYKKSLLGAIFLNPRSHVLFFSSTSNVCARECYSILNFPVLMDSPSSTSSHLNNKRQLWRNGRSPLWSAGLCLRHAGPMYLSSLTARLAAIVTGVLIGGTGTVLSLDIHTGVCVCTSLFPHTRSSPSMYFLLQHSTCKLRICMCVYVRIRCVYVYINIVHVCLYSTCLLCLCSVCFIHYMYTYKCLYHKQLSIRDTVQ